MQIVESPFSSESFAFIETKDSSDSLVRALFDLIDFRMWFLLLGVFLCMRTSVIISIHVMHSQKKEATVCLCRFFLATGTYRILRRCAASWRTGKILQTNKLLWAFSMSTLVSLAYKAELTAFLTHIPEPQYSNSLNTFIARYPPRPRIRNIATFTRVLAVNETHKEFVPYVLRELEGNNDSFSVRLKDSLKFYKNGKVDFVVDHFTNIYKAKPVDFEPDVVPSAALDFLTDVQIVRGSIRLFMPTKKVSPVRIVNKFKFHEPYVVTKTYFYYIIKRVLNIIYESGIFSKWENSLELATAMRHLVETRDSLKASFSNVNFASDKQNWLMYLLNARYRHVTHLMTKALSINKLIGLWFSYGILLGLVSVVFVCEYIHRKLVVGVNISSP